MDPGGKAVPPNGGKAGKLCGALHAGRRDRDHLGHHERHRLGHERRLGQCGRQRADCGARRRWHGLWADPDRSHQRRAEEGLWRQRTVCAASDKAFREHRHRRKRKLGQSLLGHREAAQGRRVRCEELSGRSQRSGKAHPGAEQRRDCHRQCGLRCDHRCQGGGSRQGCCHCCRSCHLGDSGQGRHGRCQCGRQPRPSRTAGGCLCSRCGPGRHCRGEELGQGEGRYRQGLGLDQGEGGEPLERREGTRGRCDQRRQERRWRFMERHQGRSRWTLERHQRHRTRHHQRLQEHRPRRYLPGSAAI